MSSVLESAEQMAASLANKVDEIFIKQFNSHFTGRNLTEAIGEIPELHLAIMFDLDDQSFGRCLRRHIQTYWDKWIEEEAERQLAKEAAEIGEES